MRTTVTLEPDVVARLKDYAHRKRLSFKAALDVVIRRGLAVQHRPKPDSPFSVEPHRGGFRPGVDVGRLNQLGDRLETDDFLADSRADR
jgi:hypothetical protein